MQYKSFFNIIVEKHFFCATLTPSMNLIVRLLLDHVVRFLTIEPYPVWRLNVVFIHFNNLTRNIMTVQVQGVTKSKSK